MNDKPSTPATTPAFDPFDYAAGYHDGVKAALRVLEESAASAISKRPLDSVGYALRANVKIIGELRWP